MPCGDLLPFHAGTQDVSQGLQALPLLEVGFVRSGYLSFFVAALFLPAVGIPLRGSQPEETQLGARPAGTGTGNQD